MILVAHFFGTLCFLMISIYAAFQISYLAEDWNINFPDSIWTVTIESESPSFSKVQAPSISVISNALDSKALLLESLSAADIKITGEGIQLFSQEEVIYLSLKEEEALFEPPNLN